MENADDCAPNYQKFYSKFATRTPADNSTDRYDSDYRSTNCDMDDDGDGDGDGDWLEQDSNGSLSLSGSEFSGSADSTTAYRGAILDLYATNCDQYAQFAPFDNHVNDYTCTRKYSPKQMFHCL